MSSCRADNHEGFKIFCKGEIREREFCLFMCFWCIILSEDIYRWRSLNLCYVWLSELVLRPSEEGQKLEKLIQKKIPISSPLGLDANVWHRLEAQIWLCPLQTAPRVTLPPPRPLSYGNNALFIGVVAIVNFLKELQV